MVVESRRQRAAVDKYESSLRIRMIGHGDFSISSTPRVLLIETPHHLSGDALKGTELLFQIGEDLFVPIVTLIVDGHAGELLIDRQEAEAFDRDSAIRWRAAFQLVFVHMRTCSGDFHVRPRSQCRTPGHSLKTVRVVQHRYRMGKKGAAQIE